MVDITMCTNEKCLLKDKCFRYLATPDPYYQAYYILDNDDDDGSNCKLYFECKDKKTLDELNYICR